MSPPDAGKLIWSKEQIYFSQDDYFRDLLKSLATATISIAMETYIFEKGVLADRVSDALVAAAERGVKVRLLIDGIGSPGFVYDYESRLRTAGVTVRYYRILPWIFRHLPGEPEGFIRRLSYRIERLNKGDHRKMCLIDNRSLWVGSANISDVHLTEVQGSKAWRDFGVWVEGPEVRWAKQAFESAFRWGLSLRLEVRVPKLLALNQSYLQKRLQRTMQWRRLKDARQRIWIQTPYFVPVARVMRRLARKAREGVDVCILVPRQSDVWLIPWISFSFLRQVARLGIQVHEIEEGFVHRKLCLIDDWICAGSTNLDHRSFLHDLEIDVIITHEDNRRRIEEQFLSDQSQAKIIRFEGWNQIPIWKRLLYWFLGKFAYWF